MNRHYESILIVVVVTCFAAAADTEAPRFVCYYPNWAYYRPDDGKYTVDNVNPSLCTHLVYAFAKLNGTTLTIQSQDHNADITNRLYEKFVALKLRNPTLAVMIAIGGFVDSTDGDKYSRLVSNSNNINNFVTSVIAFLKENKFDGLDLDWEYPSTPADKAGFANLLRALRTAFTGTAYLLSVAVPASAEKISKGFDVPTLASTSDFVNLMTYDMHGSWNPIEADHHAPLYRRSWESESDTNNIDYSVNYWIAQGMPAGKINLGIPVYGRAWTLSDVASVDPTPPAEAVGKGAPGEFTKEPGFLGYNEICQSIKQSNWEMFRHPEDLSFGPYAVSSLAPKTWVGFDDPEMAEIKVNYTISRQLGGAMVWDISTDDFKNSCGKGKNPVMTAISRKMGIGTQQPNGRFVCYFPNWSVYRLGDGRFAVTDIDPNLCTDYVYAFAKLDERTFEMKPFDEAVDIDAGGYATFVNLTAKNPKLKTWIAIGGWSDSHESDKYSQLVSSQENIRKFVQSAYSLLKKFGFDGLDIDWEFPESESDKQGLTNLLYYMKSVFEPSGYGISIAISANTNIIDRGYNISAIKETADFVNLMAYDMHGHWEAKTDHHAPLYSRSWEDANSNNNINYTVMHLLNRGLPTEKLNLGIPLYGQSWTLQSYKTNINYTIPAKASGAGNGGLYTNEAGYLGYNEICKSVKLNNWPVIRDPEMKNGPYAYSPIAPHTWVGYDDPEMAAYKASYVLNKKLGGAMVWDMSTDDFRSVCSSQANPILTAIALTLNGTAPTTSTSLSTKTTSPSSMSTVTRLPTTRGSTVTRFITTAALRVTKISTTETPSAAPTFKPSLIILTIAGLLNRLV